MSDDKTPETEREAISCHDHGNCELCDWIEKQLAAEREARVKEKKILADFLRDMCEEWNDKCEPSCDSFGHDDLCRAVSIVEAYKFQRARADTAEERLRVYEEALRKHDALLVELRDAILDADLLGYFTVLLDRIAALRREEGKP